MRIRTKLQITFISASIILAASILSVTYFSMGRHFEQQEGNRLKENLAHLAKTIDNFMFARVADFNLLSSNPLFSTSSNEVTSQYLVRVVNEYPFYDNLFFVNKKGIVLSSSDQNFIGANILQLEPDIEDEFNKTIGGGHEEVYISSLSEVSQKEIEKGSPLDIELLSDVIDLDGNVVGVLVGFVSTQNLSELIFEDNSQIFKNEYTYLLNNKGVVLMSDNQKMIILQPHPDLLINDLQQKIKRGKNSFYVYKNLNDIKTISGFSSLSKYGAEGVGNWHLITTVPYNEIMKPLYQITYKAFFIFLLIMLALIVFIFIFSRTFSKPIAELEQAVFDFKVNRKPINLKNSNKDEIGVLSRSFNAMTESLYFSYITEAKLAKAEEMYRLLTDYSNDLICLQEPDSTFKYISPSIKTLLGYEPSDFLGKKVFGIVHKDDIKSLKGAMKKRIFSVKAMDAFTFRVRHKEGHFIWLEFLTSPVYKDKKKNYFVTSARDVTQWVLAKQEIQKYQTSLQKMTTEITLVEEKQKKEIASNIHDHLSQSLIISKMRINELKKKPQLKMIDKDLQFIETHISEALENSRKITYELSPPVLYQFGIIAALNWLLDDVETTHKIECQFNSNIAEIELNEVKSILLFRSIQEVITNAIKYANASLITLNVDKNKLGVYILITDNGVGFDTSLLNNDNNHSGSGFGLFTVQERIRNIQGKFTIVSEVNQGTVVKIILT